MTLTNAIKQVPRFMYPDLTRVHSFADLLFQVEHEIDLAESGALEPGWTGNQLREAKRFRASLATWKQKSRIAA
jgi:hypothetical protein